MKEDKLNDNLDKDEVLGPIDESNVKEELLDSFGEDYSIKEELFEPSDKDSTDLVKRELVDPSDEVPSSFVKSELLLLANYCGVCGNRFENQTDKFCPQCGKRREETAS